MKYNLLPTINFGKKFCKMETRVSMSARISVHNGMTLDVRASSKNDCFWGNCFRIIFCPYK